MFSNPEFLAEGAAIAALCEATGADRCFQNNILNLVVLCRHDGLHEVADYWEQVVELNTWQQHRMARLVVNRLFGTATGIRNSLLCKKASPHPHLPRPAGGRCSAGDRGSQGERTPDRC